MALELRGVEKRYPHGAVGAAGVDLVVEPGQFVALFGSSGSGKTTILHIAGLLLPPDEGEVLIDEERVDGRGEGPTAAVRRSKLGFVFQSPGLLPLLSAEENVDVSLRLLGVGGRSNRDRVHAALNAVEMGGRMSHRPDELSGGEQQRVAIARALVHAPKYLIADEPTGELDTKTGAGILGLLKELAAAGTAVLMASHDPAAVDFVDRAMFVTDGLVTQPERADLNQWIREGEGPLAIG
ncbi:MAG: ABC transporter ATP-binding protein [Acidimicrobiia bacterium]|nr:ABC transporter ATP-binding protein [Acidimicrobiia bacterium]